MRCSMPMLGFGEALPIFSTIDLLFASHRHGHIQQILADVYEDILTFHQRAIVFFKQPGWSPIIPNDIYLNACSMEDSLWYHLPLIRRQFQRGSQKARKVQRAACPKRKCVAFSRGSGCAATHDSRLPSSKRARET